LGLGRLSWANFVDSASEAVRTTSMIFLIFIGAMLFTRFIAISGVPRYLAGFVADLGLSQVTFMLIVSLAYIFLGMFLDSISMMLLTLPILLPVLVELDVNLIWFGIIVVKLIEIGAITP